MTIKLVDLKDNRNWLEKCSTDPRCLEREQRYARHARYIRDAYEALDPEEFLDYVSSFDLSAQELKGMCEALRREAEYLRHLNKQVIEFLKKVPPKRIWDEKK